MARHYEECHFCGGAVEEQSGEYEIRWKGELFIFENVSMGVCRQCGEKFLRPEVLEQMDRAFSKKAEPAKTIEVDVYRLEGNVA